jgi:nitrite reductase/ring-hydroxylating ferredoxin subunit
MKTWLCASQELNNDDSKGIRLEQLSLMLIRKDGQVYGYENSCPHLGVELEFQKNQFLTHEASHIICSTHGALFEIHNGECIYGPCAGEHLSPIQILEENQGIYWLHD